MKTQRGAVTIEPAVAGDLASVAELEIAAFSDPWSEASFRSVLAEPAAYFAVARDGEARDVVGYVVAWFAADEGEIANLAVGQSAQRRGTGAVLLDAALAEGRRRGAMHVYLEVRESNQAARALYGSSGFEEIGRRNRYYRKPVEDAVVLRRTLK